MENKYFKFIVPIIAIFIASGVAIFFNSHHAPEKPRSFTPRHWLADLQYTHIAITENFQKGNGNIFYPKTQNLDPIGGGGNQSLDGVADARFPVLNYVVSLLSSNQTEQIQVWRVFSFAFFLLAIAICVLLMYELVQNWWVSLLVGLGVNFTSVLLFAQHAVGTYTLTYVLILSAVYFNLLFYKRQKPLFLFLSLGLSGWAMLQGHGSFIFFVVILGNYLYTYIQQRGDQKILFIAGGISVLFLGLLSYQRMGLYLQNGGLFELGELFSGGIKGFFKANSKYLFKNAYSVSNVFLSTTIFAGLIYFIYLKYADKNEKVNIGKQGTILFVIAILNFAYYVCHVSSLVTYDFYALEAMTPTLVLLSIYSVSFVYSNLEAKKIYVYIGLVATIGFSFLGTTNAFENRFIETEEDRVQKSLDNFVGADLFLDSLGISSSEKITVINGQGGNIALMKAKRIGYVADGLETEDFRKALSYTDSKYVLSQDQFFMYDVVSAYPEVLGKLKLVATNETLSLYEKRSKKDSITGEILKDYVQSHNFDTYDEFIQNFENKNVQPKHGSWHIHGNILPDSGYFSNNCLEIEKGQEFPCTYEVKLSELNEERTGVVITGMFYATEELRKVCFNLSCHGEDGQYFSESFKISKKLKGDALNKWTRVSCKVTLPKGKVSKDDVIKVFLWNPHKGELAVDDFSFIFY